MTVLIELAVGEPRAGTRHVSPSDAETIADIAQRSGATGLRLVDATDGRPTLDPAVVGARLAGRFGDLAYVIDAETTHNAPYNLARRILSFDRAVTHGAGLVLRPGGGDEVSDAVVPDPQATDPAERWREYVDILTALWVSFPRDALIGDQAAGVVADDTRIRPIEHAGRFYRVAGPLDGPASVHGRPVVIASDVAALGWRRVAEAADAVIVDEQDAAGADEALTGGLAEAGRSRAEVSLLARVEDGDPDQLRQWASESGVDGFVLAPAGDASAIAATLQRLLPVLAPADREPLRAALKRTALKQVASGPGPEIGVPA